MGKFGDEIERTANAINHILRDRLPFSPGLSLVMDAVVAAEDRRYWSHAGIDVLAMARAAAQYLIRGRVSGASTIEQQLVRTIRQRYEITARRKFGEIVLAFMISRRFSKIDIMTAYLHVAYFGWRANGIRQAIERFNMDADLLNEDDAVLIASLLKLPMPKSPSAAYTARLERRMQYVQAALIEH